MDIAKIKTWMNYSYSKNTTWKPQIMTKNNNSMVINNNNKCLDYVLHFKTAIKIYISFPLHDSVIVSTYLTWYSSQVSGESIQAAISS